MMEHAPKYTGVIILTDPVYIIDSKGNTTFIYGILYDMLWKMKDDLFSWGTQRYLGYLYGAQRFQFNNSIIEPDVWITSDGEMIILDNPTKNYIYKVMNEGIPVYRYMEFLEPLELKENEYEDCFLISPEPLKRYNLIDDTWFVDVKKYSKDREPLTKYLDTLEHYSKMEPDCDSDEILVKSSHPLPPMSVEVGESNKKFLDTLLLTENCMTLQNESLKNGYLKYSGQNILSFDEFINETMGSSSNIQSYFGCLDEEDDDE